MQKSFGGAHWEEASAAMHNQLECTSTTVPSQILSKNVPVRSRWSDFQRCWPLPAEVAESRDLKGNSRETGRLQGLTGRLTVTIYRKLRVWCDAQHVFPLDLALVLRHCVQLVKQMGGSTVQGLHASLVFPCMETCMFLPHPYQPLRDWRPRVTSR